MPPVVYRRRNLGIRSGACLSCVSKPRRLSSVGGLLGSSPRGQRLVDTPHSVIATWAPALAAMTAATPAIREQSRQVATLLIDHHRKHRVQSHDLLRGEHAGILVVEQLDSGELQPMLVHDCPVVPSFSPWAPKPSISSTRSTTGLLAMFSLSGSIFVVNW